GPPGVGGDPARYPAGDRADPLRSGRGFSRSRPGDRSSPRLVGVVTRSPEVDHSSPGCEGNPASLSAFLISLPTVPTTRHRPPKGRSGNGGRPQIGKSDTGQVQKAGLPDTMALVNGRFDSRGGI